MQNRITEISEKWDRRNEEPQPVGDILEELLSLYERRFPDIQIAVVETSATAV